MTRCNLADVPSKLRLLDRRAQAMLNRLFYNGFQDFPRSMEADMVWEQLLVTAADFDAPRHLRHSRGWVKGREARST